MYIYLWKTWNFLVWGAFDLGMTLRLPWGHTPAKCNPNPCHLPYHFECKSADCVVRPKVAKYHISRVLVLHFVSLWELTYGVSQRGITPWGGHIIKITAGMCFRSVSAHTHSTYPMVTHLPGSGKVIRSWKNMKFLGLGGIWPWHDLEMTLVHTPAKCNHNPCHLLYSTVRLLLV